MPELAEIDPSVIRHFFGAVQDEKSFLRLELKDLADFVWKMRSLAAAGGFDANRVESLAQVFDAQDLKPYEQIMLLIMARPDLKDPILYAQAHKLPLIAPLLKLASKTGFNLKTVLEMLAGRQPNIFRKLKVTGVDFTKPLTIDGLKRIYQQLLGDMKKTDPKSVEIPVLEDALARTYLAAAEDLLIWDQKVDSSFKGLANTYLMMAERISPRSETDAERLRTQYGVREKKDTMDGISTDPVAMLARVARGMGNDAKLKFKEKLDRMDEGEADLIKLKQMLDDPDESKRDQALQMIAEGWNLYVGTKTKVNWRELKKGAVSVQVRRASQDTLLARFIEMFDLPDIPVITIVVDEKNMKYLRKIEFFTATGQANATRPDQTRLEAVEAPGDWQGQAEHFFRKTGYLVAQDGYESETLEHEYTHVLDFGLDRPAVDKKDGNVDELLLTENEAYTVQLLLGKLQSSGRTYDDNNIESVFFSYAMDRYGKEERKIQVAKWAELYDAKFGAPKTAREIRAKEAAKQAYEARLVSGEDAPAKYKEMDAKAKVKARPDIIAAGIEARKEAKLAQVRQLRSAVRYAQRYWTPAQIKYYFSMATKLDDIIHLLGMGETEMKQMAVAIDAARADWKKDTYPRDSKGAIPSAGSKFGQFKTKTAAYRQALADDPSHDLSGAEFDKMVEEFDQFSLQDNEASQAFRAATIEPVIQQLIELARRAESRMAFAPPPGFYDKRVNILTRYLTDDKLRGQHPAVAGIIGRRLMSAALGGDDDDLMDRIQPVIGTKTAYRFEDILADTEAVDRAIQQLRELLKSTQSEGQIAARLTELAGAATLEAEEKEEQDKLIAEHKELKRKIDEIRKQLGAYIGDPKAPVALPSVMAKVKQTLAVAPQAGRYFAELDMKPAPAQMTVIKKHGWEVLEKKDAKGNVRYFIAPAGVVIRSELRVEPVKPLPIATQPAVRAKIEALRKRVADEQQPWINRRVAADELRSLELQLVDVRKTALDYVADKPYEQDFKALLDGFNGTIEMNDDSDPLLQGGQLAYYQEPKKSGEAGRIVLNQKALMKLALGPDVVAPYGAGSVEYIENLIVALVHELAHAGYDRLQRQALNPDIADILEEIHADLRSVGFAQKMGSPRFGRYIETVLSGQRFFDTKSLEDPAVLMLAKHLFGLETMVSRLNSKVLVLGSVAQNAMSATGLQLPDNFKLPKNTTAIAGMLRSIRGVVEDDNILMVVHANDPNIKGIVDAVTRAGFKGRLHILVEKGNFANRAEQRQTVNALNIGSQLGQTYLATSASLAEHEQGIKLNALFNMIPLLQKLAQAIAEIGRAHV